MSKPCGMMTSNGKTGTLISGAEDFQWQGDWNGKALNPAPVSHHDMPKNGVFSIRQSTIENRLVEWLESRADIQTWKVGEEFDLWHADYVDMAEEDSQRLPTKV